MTKLSIKKSANLADLNFSVFLTTQYLYFAFPTTYHLIPTKLSIAPRFFHIPG